MANWMKVVLNGAHNYGTQNGAGTIDPDQKNIVFITTTGSDALVLGDGSGGQIIFLVLDVDGGDGTILSSTTNLLDYTSIVFDDEGDWGAFEFDGRAWKLLANRGLVLT